LEGSCSRLNVVKDNPCLPSQSFSSQRYDFKNLKEMKNCQSKNRIVRIDIGYLSFDGGVMLGAMRIVRRKTNNFRTLPCRLKREYRERVKSGFLTFQSMLDT
jgi:hypothetical protein